MLKNLAGKTFAEVVQTGQYQFHKGGADVIDGKRGDRHIFTVNFPLALSVGPASDGTPVFGSTTSTAGFNGLVIDPYALGANVAVQASMCQFHRIAYLELDKQLTCGSDTTLGKGRLVMAMLDDPMYGNYGTVTFDALCQSENHQIWSINPNETAGKMNRTLVFNNKKKQLLYTYTDIGGAGEMTKANEADIRQAYQCVLLGAQQGAYVPAARANTQSLGFVSCKIALDTYGRTDQESLVNLASSISRVVNTVAANRVVREPDCLLGMKDDAPIMPRDPWMDKARIGLLGDTAPKALRKSIMQEFIGHCLRLSGLGDDDSDTESDDDTDDEKDQKDDDSAIVRVAASDGKAEPISGTTVVDVKEPPIEAASAFKANALTNSVPSITKKVDEKEQKDGLVKAIGQFAPMNPMALVNMSVSDLKMLHEAVSKNVMAAPSPVAAEKPKAK